MNQRKNLLPISLALFIGLIAFAVYLIYRQHKSPAYTKTVTSPDTGESFSTQPNKIPEEANSNPNEVVLLGSYLILNNGATQAQFDKLRSSLTLYWQKNLGSQYESLTILPDTFKSNSGDMTAKLRLGDTNKLVDFHIKVSQLKYVQVVITDTTKQNGGSFNSGVMTADSTSQEPND